MAEVTWVRVRVRVTWVRVRVTWVRVRVRVTWVRVRVTVRPSRSFNPRKLRTGVVNWEANSFSTMPFCVFCALLFSNSVCYFCY